MKSEPFTDGGWWAVVNIDQRRSRRSADLVPGLLGDLATVEVALPIERTVGDEVQLLTRSPVTVATILETVARSDNWRVGIGFGEVEHPLPDSVRAARGPAFVQARAAVEAAHSSPSNLALEAATGTVGGDDYAGSQTVTLRTRRVAEARTIAGLLHHVWSRRTREGWDVVDSLRAHGTGRAAAEALGISASAVSQRLRTAGWQPAEEGRELLETLLAEVLAR